MKKSQSPYKIVVWATGAIGKYAIKATARHPDMQLVGVRVYSEAKAGKNAGEIAGIGTLGVKATMNPEGDLCARRGLCGVRRTAAGGESGRHPAPA